MTTRFEIIVGSMLGATEYVADAIEEKLAAIGYQSAIHLTPNLNDLEHDAIWLVCTSTHGAGDLPDNIQAFAEQLPDAELDQQPYLVIGLGDSSYDTFCEGGKQMHQLLHQAGGQPLADPHYVDVLAHPIPEEEALSWFEHSLQQPKVRARLSGPGVLV
ncbi:Protein MioC like protein [Saliniradius amylolyticus]|uniref:Protein MioC like protein n=1 Tax=Saliniradius amylolyticus TaxID=2183582 RepID=A0A2S2E756_9ALTE|nr:flavodoxin domain-containing protein [Saliniradius amylolyticus]AWL13449.1 Protein MioC like protein [Saliniradius amylolyticus]